MPLERPPANRMPGSVGMPEDGAAQVDGRGSREVVAQVDAGESGAVAQVDAGEADGVAQVDGRGSREGLARLDAGEADGAARLDAGEAGAARLDAGEAGGAARLDAGEAGGAAQVDGRGSREGAASGLEPASLTAPATETGDGGWSGTLGDRPTWLIAGAVFAVYTVISVFRYLRRAPTSWDLGIFTEYVKQLAHFRAPVADIRGTGINLLGDHFHPIVALIAPFFRLFPSPVTLLVAQALLAAISVFPVSRAGRELLGQGAGRAIAAAYGLSWGLQQMANYDFHEIAFAVPLLAFSLSGMVRGRMRAAVLWALPLVFVKEDQGFTIAVIGLIMAFAYRRRGLGLFLAAWGVGWSLLAILVIIPHFNAHHTYPYWAAGGGISPVGGHFTLSGLWASLNNGISTKLPTLALILLPTAFIALRSPLILAVLPSLALRFIGNNPYYWGTDWHYNATVMPIVFIAAIDGMTRIRAAHAAAPTDARRSELSSAEQPLPLPISHVRVIGAGAPQLDSAADLARHGQPQPRRGLGYAMEHYGAAAMLAICAALAFQFPLSSLWTPATYKLGPHVAAENRAIALVPNGATVATDLDLLAPLAPRTDTFWLGNFPTNPPTQYVVFDTQSTDWQPPPQNVLGFIGSLIHGARYRQIYTDNGVYVFRRSG